MKKTTPSERHEALQPFIHEQDTAGLPHSPFWEESNTHAWATPEEHSKNYLAAIGKFLTPRPNESIPDFSNRVALFFAPVESYNEKIPILLDRATTDHRFTLLAAALAAYHADHSTYPPTLAPLQAPAYLKLLPLDPFSAKPFLYRPTDTGYLLYSVGGNGLDDNAKDKSADGDDIVLRMP